MKIFYALYELKPISHESKAFSLPVRNGALLKIQWTDQKIGYADLHPWPELGDPTLEEHLSSLREFKLTEMTEQAIWLASLDAQGRQDKVNIFDNQILLRNNAIVNRVGPHTVELLDPLIKKGFSTAKLKVGISIDEEVQMINRMANTHNLKLRLDFNSRLTWKTFSQYILGLTPTAKKLIEYVEDPFPYDAELWKEARQIVPLAIDWELRKISKDLNQPIEADVFVLKPTHQDIQVRLAQAEKWNKFITVTSHMGHPLGVMQCLQVAQQLHKAQPNRMRDPGCMTFDVFEPTEFHSLLNIQGPYVRKVGGWGIGFDFILKGQKWNQLRS